MPNSVHSAAINIPALKHLAGVVHELSRVSSAEQLAGIVARGTRDLCRADGIALHRQGFAPLEHWPTQPRGEAPASSVSLMADTDGPLTTLSVHWRMRHAVSSEEMAMLDVLAHTAALVLKALPEPLSRPAGPYIARERARFFGFQRQVRSLLALVRSIVRSTVDTADSTEEYAAHLEGRLGALARVQGFLLRAAGARVDLEELVRAEFLAQSIAESRTRVAGPRILLTGKAAETLGLALHELTTNAIKFGALRGTHGTVEVLWRIEGRERARVKLVWREGGAAVDLPSDVRKGFGFELLEKTLPYELEGMTALDLAPTGLVCSVTFPTEPDELLTQRERP